MWPGCRISEAVIGILIGKGSYCGEETVVGVVNARKKMVLTSGSHLSVWEVGSTDQEERGNPGWAGLVRAAAGLLPGWAPGAAQLGCLPPFFVLNLFLFLFSISSIDFA
jgi:hypothetical protein